MCPKFKKGVCEVVNLEPEHVIKCGADRDSCYKSNEYEICKLYMVDRILDFELFELSLKAAA